MNQSHTKGFSSLEILFAGAVFVVFSWGVIEVLLLGLSADRLSQEVTVATAYATEGLEATRALSENTFDVLVPMETGVIRQGDEWLFDGEENIFEEKYRRVITLEQGRRNNAGEIVTEEGAEDPDTVVATVTVRWQRTPTQTDSVVLHTYFTRWR